MKGTAMLKKVDLAEIAQKNPTIDLEELDRWRKLRQTLIETGLRGRRQRGSFPFAGKRAHIVDDADSDPRIVRLHRN
jgi:hypothetical protein